MILVHKLAAVLALGMESARLHQQAMVEDTVSVSRVGMETSAKAEASARAQSPMMVNSAAERSEAHV
jgi:hypothetical protein